MMMVLERVVASRRSSRSLHLCLDAWWVATRQSCHRGDGVNYWI